MRMIEADKLEKAMEDAGVLRRDLLEPGLQFQSAWGVPVVDAEPVVRCRRCVHGHGRGSGGYSCDALDSYFHADFFCGFGKDQGYERRCYS